MNGFSQITSRACVALTLVAALATTGCGSEENTAVTSQDAATSSAVAEATRSIPLQGGEFAHIKSDSVLITHAASQQTVATIVALHPRDLVWSARTQSLYWIEDASFDNAPTEEKAHSVLRQLDVTSGVVESLFWSRTPIEGLDVSQVVDVVSFEQEDVLYTLAPEQGEVHRVAPWVEHMEWSPTEAAFVVSYRKTTEYVAVESDGAIASRVPLIEGSRFAGPAFVDEKTVVGLQWTDNDVVLKEIDLRSTQLKTIGTWSTNPADAANDRFSIAANTSGTQLMVYQQPADAPGTLWQWSVDDSKKTQLTAASGLLGWVDDQKVWYTVPSPGDEQGVSIHEFDSVTGADTTPILGVDAPAMIQYTVQ